MRYEAPADPSAVAGELADVYAAVFAEPPYNEGPKQTEEFAGIYRRHATQPGFGVVLALDEDADDRVVAFAYGAARRPGWWWRHCDTTVPDEMAGLPLFAFYEWAVLPAYRLRGVGGALLARLLDGRPEPWVTLNVNLKADAYRIYRRAGWRQVGRCRSPGWPEMAVMVKRIAT